MDPSHLLLYTTTRVLHVGTAIVLVGGTFFVRYVLLPAATRELSDADHARLRERVMAAWKRVVMLGIALLLVSGAINYYRVLDEGSHKGDALYHALLGTKIILALAVFFIASALVGRSPALEPIRKNARTWLTINLILAATIVVISGFLKVRSAPASPLLAAPAAAAAASAPIRALTQLGSPAAP